MGRGKGPKPVRGIVAILRKLGADVRPTSERGRRQLVLIRGLGEVARAAKEGRAPRLTNAQAREVANERRRLQRADEWRPRTKGAPKIQRYIADWFKKQDKLSKISRAKDKGGDIADRAKRSVLDAIRREREVKIAWIPNDPSKLHKTFNTVSAFRRFVRRPHYRDAFKKEQKEGRFVVALFDDETGELKRDKKGRVIVVRELEG